MPHMTEESRIQQTPWLSSKSSIVGWDITSFLQGELQASHNTIDVKHDPSKSEARRSVVTIPPRRSRNRFDWCKRGGQIHRWDGLETVYKTGLYLVFNHLLWSNRYKRTRHRLYGFCCENVVTYIIRKRSSISLTFSDLGAGYAKVVHWLRWFGCF